MTHNSRDKLEHFFHALEGVERAILLLDYDGTLAPFRLDRFQARPYAGVRELITRIQDPAASRMETRIAIITGRPAGEIEPLLNLDSPVEVWGLHGAERLYPDGRRELEEVSPAIQAKLDDLKDQLRHDSFGGLFEDKPNAAVMHWRGIGRRMAQKVERRALALFEPLVHAGGMSLLQFEAGVELRVGHDKGGAVGAILSESPGCPVAFLGDDVTDEEAFRAINASGRFHLSALVRRARRQTEAEVWLKPPEELRSFLRRWITATKGH